MPPAIAKSLEDLPPDILDQVARIRDEQFRHLGETLPQVYGKGRVRVKEGGKWVWKDWDGLKDEVRNTIATIRKSDYADDVIDRELKRLSSGHYQRVREILVRNMREAIWYADRYGDLLDFYHARERFRMLSNPAGAELLTTEEVAFLGSVESFPAAEAAVTWSLRRRAKLAQPEKQLLELHKVPTRDGNLNLSEYLHGKAAAESRTMGRIVERSIREGESLDRTSKLLVDMVERDAAGAAKIAENKEFPKLVKQLKKAGAELAEGGGSEVEWYRIQDRLEKYTGNLRRGGRVHKAYVELLQDVEKRGPGYVDQAAEKWLYQWQRYAADRIGNTEAQHAYRSRQYEQEKGRPWITEYTWMMNPALHAQFAKYKKVPKKGKSKGHRCDCEIYDGETVSADWVRARPMGLHPF